MSQISENTKQLQLRPGFWKRQFVSDATTKQIKFDIIFGIVLPIMCIVADPCVFKSWDREMSPILRSLRLLAYFEIVVGIAGLILALVQPRKAALIAGLLFAGAVFSLVLGCQIFPYSVIGIIFFGLGLLSFAPFLTSFVFARNAIRILKKSIGLPNPKAKISLCIAACVVLLLAPSVLQMEVNRTINKQIEIIFSGTPDEAKAAGKRLKPLLPFTQIDYLAFRYSEITDPKRSQLGAEIYKEMTGKDINEIWRFVE